MTTDLGRVASPNRLPSSTEPSSGLGPTGFDPARITALVERVRNLQETEDHPAMANFWGEIAEKFEECLNEMERRDESERRNCLNWGPCSRMMATQSTGETA